MTIEREVLRETFLRDTQNLGALLSEGRFRQTPARKSANPAGVIAYAVSAYRDIRVAGADLDDADDLFRFQWGYTKPSGSWEPSGLARRPPELAGKEPTHRYLDISREVRGSNSGSDANLIPGIVRLSVTIFYDVNEAADQTLPVSDICIRNPEDLPAAIHRFERDPFVADLLAQPPYIITATTSFAPSPWYQEMPPRNPFIRIEPRYLEPSRAQNVLFAIFFLAVVLAPPSPAAPASALPPAYAPSRPIGSLHCCNAGEDICVSMVCPTDALNPQCSLHFSSALACTLFAFSPGNSPSVTVK